MPFYGFPIGYRSSSRHPMDDSRSATFHMSCSIPPAPPEPDPLEAMKHITPAPVAQGRYIALPPVQTEPPLPLPRIVLLYGEPAHREALASLLSSLDPTIYVDELTRPIEESAKVLFGLLPTDSITLDSPVGERLPSWREFIADYGNFLVLRGIDRAKLAIASIQAMPEGLWSTFLFKDASFASDTHVFLDAFGRFDSVLCIHCNTLSTPSVSGAKHIWLPDTNLSNNIAQLRSELGAVR